MVLVMRGGAAYKKDLPSGTYINTADFKTIRDLASYLRYLDGHDEQYIQYLKRMEEHESVYETYISKHATGKIECLLPLRNIQKIKNILNIWTLHGKVVAVNSLATSYYFAM